MRTRQLLVILLIFSQIFPCTLLAEDSAGKFTYITGNASVKRAEKVLTPVVGDPIFTKDLVSTQDKSRAKILLVDESLLTIGPNSTLEITESMIKDGKRTDIITLTLGKLHTKVEKLLTPEERFEVHTPTAVAGVRGTEWVSIVKETNPSTISSFYVLKGSLFVQNPEFPTQGVTVLQGQHTIVPKGAPPSPPSPFSLPTVKETLDDLDIKPPPTGQGGPPPSFWSPALIAIVAAIGAVIIGGIIAGMGNKSDHPTGGRRNVTP